jgi:hypothetical protein
MQASTQITAPTNAFWTFSNIRRDQHGPNRGCGEPLLQVSRGWPKGALSLRSAEASTDHLVRRLAGSYELVFTIARYTDGQTSYGRETDQSVGRLCGRRHKSERCQRLRRSLREQVIGPLTVASPQHDGDAAAGRFAELYRQRDLHTVMVLDDLSVRTVIRAI